jgi:hypothetical protein
VIGDFAVVRQALGGRDVVLLGNGPTARDWDGVLPGGGALVTVNSGLKLLAERGLTADLLWIQDERFVPAKAAALLPLADRARLLAVNERIVPQLPPDLQRRAIGLRMLGYSGFSLAPPVGVCHGYNVVYGALQLLLGAGVRRIDLHGVGMLYWSTATRFDQATRGADVDLHRASDQVALLSRAIATVRRSGVEVQVHGPSALAQVVEVGQAKSAFNKESLA